MFDLISTRDLIVLAIAGTATALVIAVAHWLQARPPRRGDEDTPRRS